MASTLSLFQGFRIIQTRMMVLHVLHELRPNQKMKSILEGCANINHLWGSTLSAHNLYAQPFFQSHSVYIRFTHIANLQPKFYISSAMHHTLDREYSRSKKKSQVTNERLVHVELALRYWREQDNLFAWTPIPIYTERPDYRSLEMSLIQEWQPRLNYPFMCQIFHPKKGLLTRPPLTNVAQFGTATLWRRAKHKFTPKLIRDILNSDRFRNRLELWTIIHALGANTKARFEQTRMLRSSEGGLSVCYALRRLANNTQEPFRTLSLQAIDNTIHWWKGKPEPKASPLRAPWCLSPNLSLQLRQFLRHRHLQFLQFQVPCHPPSFKSVFAKHSAVLDQLCNHKQAIAEWSSDSLPQCCCTRWSQYRNAALNSNDLHWVLAGYLLAPMLPPSLGVIAEGSLLNKVFPSKTEFLHQLHQGLHGWSHRNGLPTIPRQAVNQLGTQLWQQHTENITHHITKSSISQFQTHFEGAIFHCEDKQSSSLHVFCPCLYHQAITQTFTDPSIFQPIQDTPETLIDTLVSHLSTTHGHQYPWAIGKGRTMPTGYILLKKKKAYQTGRPIISFVEAPFRPMLNILARLISQLIPVACPDHFASGDVYDLLKILREAPVNGDLVLYNQDLAGFFTSIDQDRFIGAWHMLLDFFQPHMNVADNEVFSVYPGTTNNPGDLIKGRTFRKLNVTRKIIIKTIPSLLRTALNMQTFALGHRCIKQQRGSPMGSPLSPALCL